MLRFLISFFVLSSLFVSCGYPRLPDYSEGYSDIQTSDLPVIFHSEKALQYQADLIRKQDTFTGVFFFKPAPDGSYKIAMTTDMGYKLFDLQLMSDSIYWNYVFQDMDHGIIRKVLERQFRTLLLVTSTSAPVQRYSATPAHQRIHLEDEKVYIYTDSEAPEKVTQTCWTKGKKVLVQIDYSRDKNENPGHIVIQDEVANMKITLNKK